jgi:hypothetical protein
MGVASGNLVTSQIGNNTKSKDVEIPEALSIVMPNPNTARWGMSTMLDVLSKGRCPVTPRSNEQYREKIRFLLIIVLLVLAGNRLILIVLVFLLVLPPHTLLLERLLHLLVLLFL